MKIAFVKEKRWQRLLTVVVMLFTFGSLARAGADLVVVAAGYGHYEGEKTLKEVDAVVRHLSGDETNENNRFWVDIKNIGDKTISNKDGQSIIENGNTTTREKLGIAFELNGKWTNETGSWNDSKEWEISVGNVVRFYVNGGATNPLNELSGEQSLKITIAQNENGKTYNLLPVPPKDYTAKFTTDGSNVTIIYSTFYKELPSGYTAIKIGAVNTLEQGKQYSFNGSAGCAKLWGSATSENPYTFGWFDEEGKFLGLSGSYEVKSPNETNRNYYGKYYDIIPVADDTKTAVDERYAHLNYNSNHTGLNSNNYGAIYIGGSKDGFGIPEVNRRWGWDGENNKGDNDEIRGSAIPQIEKGIFSFDLTTGEQALTWGKTGQPLLCKLFHYKKWSIQDDNLGGDKQNTHLEFRANGKKDRSENIKTSFSFRGEMYNYQTYYHFERDTEDSPLGGAFEITNSDRGERGNGNIHGVAIGQDSDLPKFPHGYTFNFILDLKPTQLGDDAKWNLPIKVTQTAVPDNSKVLDGDNVVWHADEIKNISSKEDYANKTITVSLSDNTGEKRISLRDAFRFDWNIPYKYSNPRGEDEKNLISIHTLNVRGELSVNDLYYLGDLIVKGKITELDLSNATIAGNKIPAEFAAKGENDPSKLETIKLPANTIIGSNAFKNCKALVNVEFAEGGGTAMVGAGAFWGCDKLSNETINEIIAHTQNIIMENTFRETKATDITIPNTITEIQANAFAGCKLLKKVRIPATFSGKESKITTEEDWIMPGQIGTVYVGSKNTDAARKARTLSDANDAKITLEGEDFNQTQGSGWFNNGDHDKITDTGVVTSTYRTDIDTDDLSFGIGQIGTNYKLGWMHSNYWFNYSFRVTSEGSYKITAKMATNNVLRKPAFAIDGGQSISVEVTQPGWEPWGDKNTIINIASVNLKPGIHYITYYGDEGTDLDKMIIERVADLSDDKTDITPGYVSGDVVTVYKLQDGSPSNEKAMKTHTDAFKGVKPNNCEVVFESKTSEDGTKTDMSDDMVAAYRDNVKNPGILQLLTKELNEDSVYSCVNQRHADVEIKRTFRAYIDVNQRHNNWYSIVLPFDVKAADLINARAKATDNAEAAYDQYVFDRAALIDQSTFNREGYPDVHFSYLNGTSFLAKVTAYDKRESSIVSDGSNKSYEIGELVNGTALSYVNAKGTAIASTDKERVANTDNGDNIAYAGEPFIVRIDATDRGAENDNVIFSNVKFYDVRTYPTDDKENGKQTKSDNKEYGWNYSLTTNVVKTSGKTLYQFKGNLYKSKFDIKEGVFYLNGYWYEGSEKNNYLRVMRSYFEVPSTGSDEDVSEGKTQLARLVFGGTTGIADIEVGGNVNGNIYNLNGQLVRKDGSMQGLPKGVFIINGKRVVIK